MFGQNGFWGEFAKNRGSSVRQAMLRLPVHRGTLYRFLNGDLHRIGKAKRRVLCRLWKIKWPDLREAVLNRARTANSGSRTEIRSRAATMRRAA